MSNEEMRKKMEFIVEQRAQFAADIGVLREVQAADAKLLKEEITVLKELYRNLSDALTTVVGLVGTLAQTQTRTEERRNAFINVVERYIRGNGGSENPA
jgi:hypothetical protein